MNAKQRWTLLAAIFGSSIVFLDATIVTVALPKIGKDLPASVVGVLEGQTYVVSGYLATLAALLVLAGALADYYGRRRIFVVGLVGFGITSLLCGLAPNLELLVLFRILQGATGALLVPCSLSIITATFTGPDRARAFGIWAAATSAATLFGQVLGGVLVTAVAWRAAFLINVPLGLVALWLTLRYMDESRDEGATARFDWLGAGVAVLAVGGLAFGAIRGQERNWEDPLAFVALGIGVVATILFPILMAVRPNPLVPLSLFRSRAFAVVNVATLLVYGALYVSGYFQSLFLQGVLGYSPLASGLTGLPVGLLLAVLSTRVGSIAGRRGAKVFLVAGPLLMAGAMLWWARVPADSPAWAADPAQLASLVPPAGFFVDPLPAVLVFGVGISLLVAPLTSTLMSSVPVNSSGLASAINNAISRVGAPLVSAVIFIVVSGSFYSDLARRVPGLDPGDPQLHQQVQPLNPPESGTRPEVVEAARTASADAFHIAAIVCAILLAAGGAAAQFGLPEPEASTEVRDAPAA